MPSQLPSSPIAVHTGRFTEAHATRLLWRAGFGPRPGQAKQLAALGLDGAVASLTRPQGAAKLIGPSPRNSSGGPLQPYDVWGDDHCWWLDRMVRSTHQFIERMTLVWHSWFATSVDSATAKLMIDQNQMMRRLALGSFHDLLLEVTKDPAMLLFLNGAWSTRYDPNENYGREMMELFTLGADRGYSEADVHNQALALTGWVNDYGPTGPENFRFEASQHDPSTKTIFGQRGNFAWQDSCRLCVQHRLHPSFMIAKLWGYFIAGAPSRATLKALETTYVKSGYAIRPLMEAILRHPSFYDGARMVLPPIVHTAGMLRALGEGVTTDDWGWIGVRCGQRLFEPPNVAGWNYADWLDTARWSGRFTAIGCALQHRVIDPGDKSYPADETPAQALQSALNFWHNPALSASTMSHLSAFAGQAGADITEDWEKTSYRVIRQNALRALIPSTPDWQTC